MTTTNKDAQRDQLALLVHDAQYGESDVTPRYWPLHIHKAADAILAADYRKPRTITTVEGLDALPMGAAILDTHRAVWVNDGDTVAPWASLGEGDSEGGPIWVHSVDIALPATVLHEPEAEVAA